MNEKIINTIKEVFNVETNEIIIVERLLGGKSHYTYHIKVKGIDYIIRIIGQGGNLFVDRKEEYENLNNIAKLNLNNETVYFDINTGTKVAKYLNGTVLSQIDTKEYLNEIAVAFKTLHESNIKPYKDYGLKARLKKYESYNTKLLDKYIELRNVWLKLYDKHYNNRPKVFCHNDLQKSNMIIDNNNKVFLLDWEYAAANEFYYDIASFGEYNIELLEVYLNRKPTNTEIRDVWFYKMYQNLQWHQVAEYKENINLSKKLNVDFKELSKYFLNEAQKHYLLIKDGY